jgi:hypothetical protein
LEQMNRRRLMVQFGNTIERIYLEECESIADDTVFDSATMKRIIWNLHVTLNALYGTIPDFGDWVAICDDTNNTADARIPGAWPQVDVHWVFWDKSDFLKKEIHIICTGGLTMENPNA